VGVRPRTDTQTRVTTIYFASSTTHAKNVTTAYAGHRPTTVHNQILLSLKEHLTNCTMRCLDCCLSH